jgi:hypothetical protein
MNTELCPICGKGILSEQTHLHSMKFFQNSRKHDTVELKHSICDYCGEWITTPEQSKFNKNAIITSKNLLIGAIQ